MTKAEFISAIAETTGDTKKGIEGVLDAITGQITKTLASGVPVPIPGFGKFDVTERPARTARNPATGETIQVGAKRVVKFRPAAELKKALA